MLTKLMIITTLLWAGMVGGISFLESWVKFRAPTLTKPVGLDVGRTVFRFFHTVQCALLLILIFFSIITKSAAFEWLAIIILTSILLLQLVWLFPKLNQRAQIIIAGNVTANSCVHTVYGVLEAIKLCILLVLGWGLIP